MTEPGKSRIYEVRRESRNSSWQGERRVEFNIESGFSLTTGAPMPDEDW